MAHSSYILMTGLTRNIVQVITLFFLRSCSGSFERVYSESRQAGRATINCIKLRTGACGWDNTSGSNLFVLLAQKKRAGQWALGNAGQPDSV